MARLDLFCWFVPSLAFVLSPRAGPMKGVYLSIVPVLTIDVASSMRRRQSRLGYRNILRIADGYVPTVGEKSGNYATIHNSNGAERNSRSLLQSIQSEGLDMTSLIIQSVVGTLFSHSCL